MEDTPSSSCPAAPKNDGAQRSTSHGSLTAGTKESKEDSKPPQQSNVTSVTPLDSGRTMKVPTTSRKRRAASLASGGPPAKLRRVTLESESRNANVEL